MRTITINGISFPWKLTAAKAKALGIKGPGDSEGMGAALASFTNDFDAAANFVLAGTPQSHAEQVKSSIADWGLDDYTSFVEQAFDPKAKAGAQTDQ